MTRTSVSQPGRTSQGGAGGLKIIVWVPRGAYEVLWGDLGDARGCLGGALGGPGSLSGGPWGYLGMPWGRLEGPLGCSGGPLGCLGRSWVALGGALGVSRGALGVAPKRLANSGATSATPIDEHVAKSYTAISSKHVCFPFPS